MWAYTVDFMHVENLNIKYTVYLLSVIKKSTRLCLTKPFNIQANSQKIELIKYLNSPSSFDGYWGSWCAFLNSWLLTG